MYGYRHQSNGNALMTNLNSISSSLSSLDTIGIRTNNTKASVDNLIGQPRNNSIASTSLLWKGGGNKGDDRYSLNNGHSNSHSRKVKRYAVGSEIYSNNGRAAAFRLWHCNCFNSETALNFILVPLLLLTITRQVFDFLGQIWLQILMNFFTIIILIVALFGIKQQRTSYIGLFSIWALFNTVWNLIVICIHLKIRDIGLNEDILSLHTGATSWWHSNGPGCLPYNISSIQPSISILQPNIITGCRLDYHLIESTQAIIHALLSFISSLLCCCLISSIHRNGPSKLAKERDKFYKLNNIANERSKVNQDPYPRPSGSNRLNNGAVATTSLRRAANKTGSRSSQHSLASSMRSARRRNRPSGGESTIQTPRNSTSSMQRSQKYGSISSRRSNSTNNNNNTLNRRRERRPGGEVSSLTYGTVGSERSVNGGGNHRTRLSSLSSVDYLPSYQPPHSSNANLLSSYGEISSIDSYNNSNQRVSINKQTSIKSAMANGTTNPTYTGSRSSVCSQNTNTNNYDDLSYIYGNTRTDNSESLYMASSSNANKHNHQATMQQIYQANKNTTGSNSPRTTRNGFRSQPGMQPQKIHAETYQMLDKNSEIYRKKSSDTMTSKTKLSLAGGSFQSFTAANQLSNRMNSIRNGSQQDDESHLLEVNNNHMSVNYSDEYDKRGGHTNGNYVPDGPSPFGANQVPHHVAENSSNLSKTAPRQQAPLAQTYVAQRNPRPNPIYLNHDQNPLNGNSETPI